MTFCSKDVFRSFLGHINPYPASSSSTQAGAETGIVQMCDNNALLLCTTMRVAYDREVLCRAEQMIL